MTGELAGDQETASARGREKEKKHLAGLVGSWKHFANTLCFQTFGIVQVTAITTIP